MSSFSFKPASEFPIPQIADLLTRGFEGYLVPINIDGAELLSMLRRDGIDLNESRILLKDDEPIGVALIARRGCGPVDSRPWGSCHRRGTAAQARGQWNN